MKKRALEYLITVLEERDGLRREVEVLERELERERRDLNEICKEQGIDIMQWRFKRNVSMPNALFAKVVAGKGAPEESTFTYDSGITEDEEA